MRTKLFFCALLGLCLFGWAMAAHAAPKVIKLAYMQNTGDQMDVLGKKAKAYIEEKTNGRYRIDLIGSGKMGSEEAMFTSLRTGVLPMCFLTAPGWADPVMNLVTVPYSIKDLEHFYKVYEGEVARRMAEQLSKTNGVTPIYHFHRIHQFIFTTKPLIKPEDWPKFKIRTSTVPAAAAQVLGCGGNVVPLPFPEVYMALKTGVVDGVQTVVDWFVSFKLYEACKYAIDVKHDWAPMAIYFNDKFSASLPPEDYKIFVEAFTRQKEENETWVDENFSRYLQKLQDEGVQLTTATDEEVQQYKRQCRALLRKNPDIYGGIELLEMIFRDGGFTDE